MLVDRTHRRWAVATLALLVAAGLLYVPYARSTPHPGGGTAAGIGYGIAGFAFMLYAGLMGARKRVRVWRLGRAQTWMRGHLWLGLLSFPLILLHSGFTFGTGLTAVLMWMLAAVVVSGILGAWLQHTVPRRLLQAVPMETIYEQIDHVRVQLLDEADTIVAEAAGKLELEVVAPGAAAAGRQDDVAAGFPRRASAAALASTARIDAEDSAPLREFYLREMRPFVERPSPAHPLADAGRAAARFAQLRGLVPAVLHAPIADLENICEEERQLFLQARLHGILHGWLLVHVPLSVALLVLSAVHVVMALRY